MVTHTPLLATLQKRLIAAVIDFAPILLFVIIGIAVVSDANYDPSTTLSMILFIYVFYHGAFLARWHGETPGKRFMDIGVVGVQGNTTLSSLKCFGRPLVQIGFMFAGVGSAVAFHIPVLLAIPALIDSFLVLFLPTRQSVADLICRTIVVNLPPLQPHRAPAAPMFSATDAEFGFRPRRGK